MNVKELTHSQQQPQAPKTHKKEPTMMLKPKSGKDRQTDCRAEI